MVKHSNNSQRYRVSLKAGFVGDDPGDDPVKAAEAVLPILSGHFHTKRLMLCCQHFPCVK